MICEHCGKAVRFHHTEQTKKQILELRGKGYSFRDIEAKLDVSYSAAARICRNAASKKSGKSKN